MSAILKEKSLISVCPFGLETRLTKTHCEKVYCFVGSLFSEKKKIIQNLLSHPANS